MEEEDLMIDFASTAAPLADLVQILNNKSIAAKTFGDRIDKMQRLIRKNNIARVSLTFYTEDGNSVETHLGGKMAIEHILHYTLNEYVTALQREREQFINTVRAFVQGHDEGQDKSD